MVEAPVAPVPPDVAREAPSRPDFRWTPRLMARFGYDRRRAVTIAEVMQDPAVAAGGSYSGTVRPSQGD